jgi:hypothetical protein
LIEASASMQSRVRQPARFLLLAALGCLVLIDGVVPAVSHIDSDFGNYLTSAEIVAHGGAVERLYDDAWFQDQMHRYGTWSGIPGKFSPFTPPTALLLVPLASLSPLDALRAVTAASLLGLACAIALLRRILGWSPVGTALLVLASGFAVINALRLGQPYILVSLACIAGYYARSIGRPWLAGACFGIFVPLKYFPVVMLIYFACRREWRLVAGGAAVIGAILAISVATLGWGIHEQYLASVLGDHLVGKISLQDPFTASFQSWDSLLRRLFVLDPEANPHPWLVLPGLRLVALAAVKAGIALAALMALIRGWAAGEAAVAPSIGLIGVATLLLAPATATYHCTLLWLPVGLAAACLLRQDRGSAACVLLGCYVLACSFPHRWINLFEGRGALTVLAYPRLWLLLVMFIVCVSSLRQIGSRAAPAAVP